jgi:hypothetical protein
MCVTATNNNGALVTLQSCTGASNQQWTFSGGQISVFGNMCLDVTNGSTANGNKLQVWSCTGGPNQQWYYTAGDDKQCAFRCMSRQIEC